MFLVNLAHELEIILEEKLEINFFSGNYALLDIILAIVSVWLVLVQ